MLWFLPVLTGFLLVASFPRANQGCLAWVALIPLIVFISHSKTILRALGGGFVAAAIELFSLFIWIPGVLVRYGGLSAALAWLAYALLISALACFAAASCAATRLLMLRGGSGFLFFLPPIWILLEYAQSIFPFGGLPWLLLGYTQTGYLRVAQLADITGIYGISFLILWTNTAIAFLLLHRKRARAVLPLAIAGLWIAACLFYGSYSLRKWDAVRPNFQAAMLQGNLSIDVPEPVLADRFQRGYVKMADACKSKPDLLILPESPTPLFFQSDPSYRQVLDRLASRFSLGLIFNNVDFREAAGGTQYYNSAYFLDEKGRLKGVYDKIHLVPFGEYIPLKRLFFFAETISKDVGSFHAGRDYQIVELGTHPSNAVICFEAVFPELTRRFVANGSQLIVNLTNDAWYGRSAAPYQHLAIARMRAVENRRYLLRAANSGISAIVAPTGRLQVETPLFQEAVCEGRFEFIVEKTLYTRYGDVFVFLCAIISLGSMILAHCVAVRKRLIGEE